MVAEKKKRKLPPTECDVCGEVIPRSRKKKFPYCDECADRGMIPTIPMRPVECVGHKNRVAVYWCYEKGEREI